MSDNYIIVLFKNKKKKKIIKSYSTEKNAYTKYKHLLTENKKITFAKKVENAETVNYELALLTNQSKIQKTLFIKDELGRNNVVSTDDKNYVFLDISKYEIEETLFDWQTQKKIKFDYFIKKYCTKKELKSIYTLHNKICVQIEDNVNIFSLKDKLESQRFLNILQKYFIDSSRQDAIFVSDVSSAQRKWVYNILEEKGFDKKRLYRLKTTFSKR